MTIKMVRELEKSEAPDGAFYKYLEGLLHFELIDKPEVTLEQKTSLQEKSAKIARQLANGKIDHSIGLLYWQIAQTDLDKVGSGDFDGESLKRSAVILDRVLPTYFRIAKGLN